MKLILLNIALCFASLTIAQGRIGLLFENLPGDSMYKNDIGEHSSILPRIRQNTTSIDTLNKKKNYIKVSGLVDLGYRYFNSSQYKAGIGFRIESELNKKWYFNLNYIPSIATKDSLFEPKTYFKNTQKDFNILSDFRGRVGFTPNQYFHFQVGLDQHFIGEGSRSLLLSDYGKPYPYGQIRVKFWRIEYLLLYQFFREQKENKYANKYAATHYLSFNAAKWLNISVFESVIFQPKDTLFNRGYDVAYLNPIVLYRPQEYAQGSADNVLLGLAITGKIKRYSIYSQLILDEFLWKEIKTHSKWWANKFGVQLGVKNYTTFKNYKIFNRIEMNMVRPYTFAHVGSSQNYAHQSSVLAHPYGSSFAEVLVETKWQFKDFNFKFFGSYYLRGGKGDSLNYGENIYTSYINRPFEYGHKIGQGNGYNGVKIILTGAYQLFKYNQWQVFFENHFNYQTITNKVQYVPVLGLRSQLWNDYRNY